MINILLIEDDEGIAEGLKFSLDNAGYRVFHANTLILASEIVQNNKIDIGLLDVSLPDGSGFDFYRDNVADKNIPVIFITAKDEENDIVYGFDLGAEDYITKPFSIRELLARLKRVSLRINNDTVIKVQNVTYDVDKMELKKNGNVITLSNLELKILHLLFTNHDKAVTRNEVIDLIWQSTGNDVYDHTVTVYLKRIREKIGVDIINTIKGVGYRIDAD